MQTLIQTMTNYLDSEHCITNLNYSNEIKTLAVELFLNLTESTFVTPSD